MRLPLLTCSIFKITGTNHIDAFPHKVLPNMISQATRPVRRAPVPYLQSEVVRCFHLPAEPNELGLRETI